MIMEFITENLRSLTIGIDALALVAAIWFVRAAASKTQSKHHYEKLIEDWQPPKYEEPVVSFTTRRTRSGRPVKEVVS